MDGSGQVFVRFAAVPSNLTVFAQIKIADFCGNQVVTVIAEILWRE